jgi:hypothetical protein
MTLRLPASLLAILCSNLLGAQTSDAARLEVFEAAAQFRVEYLRDTSPVLLCNPRHTFNRTLFPNLDKKAPHAGRLLGTNFGDCAEGPPNVGGVLDSLSVSDSSAIVVLTSWNGHYMSVQTYLVRLIRPLQMLGVPPWRAVEVTIAAPSHVSRGVY